MSIKAFAKTNYNGEYIYKLVVDDIKNMGKEYDIETYTPAYDDIRFDKELQKML